MTPPSPQKGGENVASVGVLPIPIFNGNGGPEKKTGAALRGGRGVKNMGNGAWGNGDVAPPRRCKPLVGRDGGRPEDYPAAAGRMPALPGGLPVEDYPAADTEVGPARSGLDCLAAKRHLWPCPVLRTIPIGCWNWLLATFAHWHIVDIGGNMGRPPWRPRSGNMGNGAWGNGDVAPPRRCKPLGGTDGGRHEDHPAAAGRMPALPGRITRGGLPVEDYPAADTEVGRALTP